MGTIFNQHIRVKYKYGLVVVGLNKEIEQEDEKWIETALRALLNTRTTIRHHGRSKLEVPLQLEKVPRILGREAGRTIISWKSMA